MTSCQANERARIERHFAANISAEDERLMLAHVADCADCRAYYERQLLLAEIDPTVPPSQERIARGLGLSPPRQLSLWPVYAGAALAACMLALLVVSPWKRDVAGEREFAARGGALKSEPAELVVFRQMHGG